MRYLFLPFLFSLPLLVGAQQRQTFSVQQMMSAAEAHLPSAQQRPLIQSAQEAAVAQLRKGYLPQASLNAQATWQTDVTAVPLPPLPGLDIPSIAKDQYRLTLELAQPIWDGGQTSSLEALQLARSAVEQQQVEVETYPVKEQIVQLTCAFLLAQRQEAVLAVAKKEVQLRKGRVGEQVKNGTAIPANVMAFEARLLEIAQQEAELQARRSAALDALSLLTGLRIQPTDSLALPDILLAAKTGKTRPELGLFALQQQALRSQEDVLRAKLRPRLNAIATIGYGRPGLNFLSNDFEPYGIIGLNFRWNLSAFYTRSTERTQLELQSQQVDVRREQFLLLNGVKRQQYVRDLERLVAVLSQDEAIVHLRESIAETAAVQLENGVLTPSEYLIEQGNADSARLNAALHGVQFLQAQWLLAMNQGSF